MSKSNPAARPKTGGSYTRDPKSGRLKQVKTTKPAEPRAQDAGSSEPDTKATATGGASSKAKEA